MIRRFIAPLIGVLLVAYLWFEHIAPNWYGR